MGWVVLWGVGGGVGGKFVMGWWGGWCVCGGGVVMCWVDLYNPHMVPHTITQGNFNFPRSTNRIKFF